MRTTPLWAPHRRALESALGSEEFQRAFDELKQSHEVFQRYPSVDALVALCQAGSPDRAGKDQALGAILRATKRDENTLFPFVQILFWESLMRLHARLARRDPNPEDLVEQVGWEFYRAVHNYDPDRLPAKIDVNIILNTRRELLLLQKKQAQEREALRARELPPEAAPVEEPSRFPISPEELEPLLRELVARGILSPLQFEAILETGFRERSVADWARRKGIPLPTAKSHCLRGLQVVRRHLGVEDPEDI